MGIAISTPLDRSIQYRPMFSIGISAAKEQPLITGPCASCRIRILGLGNICKTMIDGGVCKVGGKNPKFSFNA